MAVRVTYYGAVRESVGTEREQRAVPAAGTVRALLEEALRAGETDVSGVGSGGLVVLVNGTNVRQRDGLDTRLSDGDAVSVSGRPMPE